MKYVLIVAVVLSMLAGCGRAPMTTTQHIAAAKSVASKELGNDQVQQLLVVQRGLSIELRVYFIDTTKDNLYAYRCADDECSFALDNSSPLMSHSAGMDGFVPYEDVVKTIERQGIKVEDFDPITSYLVDNTKGGFRQSANTPVWVLNLHSSVMTNSLDISINAESGEMLKIENAITGERVP